ncbi:MAG TPA: secretin N-terminal domain-containing protein [Verrucomicrobiae bacterium]
MTIFLIIAGALGLSWPAAGQSGITIAAMRQGTTSQTVPAAFTAAIQVKGATEDDLTMNFVNVPLDQVLAYLSDAAEFIIVQETQVHGNVTINGTHLTKDKAIDLLNGELNRNNFVAIRNGRMVTITTKRDAMISRVPILTGNDPAQIPNNDTIATWIIPIRFIEAGQLVSELSPLVSPQSMVTANTEANSIIITDRQANIRHLMEIIQAVDNSARAETEIRIFSLKHANPADVVNELNSVFPGASSSDDQSPIQFMGGPGGAFGGSPFGDTGTAASGSQQRLQKATQVTAVADARIQAVIVTAPKNLMNEIASMMGDLDVKSDRDQKVSIFPLLNGDPQQVAQVLQSMFSDGSTSGSSTGSSPSSALQTRAQNNTSQMSSGTTSSSGIGSTGNGGGSGSQGGGGGGGGR